MNGLEHIELTFDQVSHQNRAALMPYYTIGFPTFEESLDVIKAISQSGADLIELGIPFSDPLADGPTIQHSTQKALEQGTNVARCLELVTELRSQGVQQPLLLMGYYNPILAYGLDRFVEMAAAAGADGFIIPDLPLEEAGEMEIACRSKQCALIYLVAPTTPVDRIAKIAAHATGFLYLVSLTGVTGARDELPSNLHEFVQRVRGAAGHVPLAIGFGISTPEQARSVGQLADGVIVGSALIRTVQDAPIPSSAAANFVSALREAF
jgi:tryptophan synthase alpha chain